MSECPAMPGTQRCPEWLCDCFIDMFPDDPTGLHPEVFVVGFPTTNPTPGEPFAAESDPTKETRA